MTAPLTLLRTFFVCTATTLLIACDSGGSNTTVIPEINSFNVYTADQTIYSFNEATRISTKRAEFDAGENQFIELDINESKPGYDYAVYAFENGIYLLDYDKANNGKITKLTQFATSNTSICSIIPKKTASKAGFQDRKYSNRSTLDLPVLFIELNTTPQDCDPLTNYRDRIDFSEITDDNRFTNKVKKSAGNSASVLGGLLINYNSGSTSTTNNDINASKGHIGFLGYNLDGSLLTFDYSIDGANDSWSTSLPSTQGTYPFSKQSSTNQAIVQNEAAVYVLNAAQLFTLNTEESNIPIQSRIDDLFAFSTEDLPSTTTIETNRSQNADSFLIKQENTLLYFENGIFTEIPNVPIQNGNIIDFDLTSDNQALVVLENPDSSQTLLFISTQSGEATTLLDAEKIELQVIANEFYINTLELEAGSGWQAHWFRSATSFNSYSNSRFLFAHDMRDMNNTLLLLSSDSEISAAEMIKPSVYAFDKANTNGRKRGVNKNNAQVDFSYGMLNTNINEIEHVSIINDKYGKIIVTGINDETEAGRAVREQYYFDPSATVSSQDPEEQSLRLMLRELL